MHDVEQIRRTLSRYAQLNDDRDAEGWSNLFSENARFVTTRGEILGREAIRADRERILNTQPDRRTKHLLGNSVITATGDTAQALTDWVSYQRFGNGAWEVSGIGRYYDRLVRQGDQWLYAENQITHTTSEAPR